MNVSDINQLLNAAIHATLNAGEAILTIYQSDDFDVSIKTDKSPLTKADKAAHNEIVKVLEKTGIPILSEEGKSIPYEDRKDWEYFWLIDPLDGTKEFINKNGEFTVNIALIEKNQPIAGIVYAPVLRDLYVSENHQGAYKVVDIDKKTFDTLGITGFLMKSHKLPLIKPNRKFTVVASRSHMTSETEEYISKIQKEHNEIEMVSKGSSLKICMVAEGIADVYPRFAPTMEWDTAAGNAIAIGSGCKVTKVDELTPLEYNKQDLLNPWFIVAHKKQE